LVSLPSKSPQFGEAKIALYSLPSPPPHKKIEPNLYKNLKYQITSPLLPSKIPEPNGYDTTYDGVNN
jgi:hypothetical protein